MNPTHFSLIIPTYNEFSNISILLERVQDILQGMDFEIIVVDDCSPDGTSALVQSLAEDNPRIKIVVRSNERGLSGAVLQGMKTSHGSILGVMDADLSHDEQILPRMIRAVEEGADLAVGSRRIPGGGADRWPWYRRLTSDLATRLTAAWLGVPLSDPMSGYFVIKRSLYENCKHRLRPQGYKILLELYERGRPANVKELPFIFKDRNQGHSKLTFRVMIQFLKSLWHLRKSGSH